MLGAHKRRAIWYDGSNPMANRNQYKERYRMKLFIHDLGEEAAAALNLPEENAAVVAAGGKFAHCKGCFFCWLKTPGRCVIKDGLMHMGALMGASSEVTIISENTYGGYSEAVKRALDRSISTSLPFFTYRGGRLHHRRRYKNRFHLRVILYGGITEGERAAARAMVKANGANMGSRGETLLFAESIRSIGGLLS